MAILITLALLLACAVSYLLGEHIGYRRGAREDEDPSPLVSEKQRPQPGPGRPMGERFDRGEVPYDPALGWPSHYPDGGR